MNSTSYGFHPHLKALTMASAAFNDIVGLPLNIYVMWLILTGPRETLASEIFSLNLAMSEILVSLSCVCLIAYVQFGSLLGFKVFIFSRGLLFTARPLFLCCICVDYYLGIVHPVLFLRFKPMRYRVACCCAVWLITLVSCIYSWCTYLHLQFLYGFLVQNILYLSVMLFCCFSVLRVLKRPGPGEKITEKKKSNTMKRRAYNIILLIVISLAVNFLLYMALIPFQYCLTWLEFSKALTICTSVVLITGFLQPVLYLHRTEKLLCFKRL